MKVICKCCHRGFDYDMYMGLCPKCGRVYRRGIAHYNEIERDMLGNFHLDGDEGGLNRGIDGVVYNQGSDKAKLYKENGFDEPYKDQHGHQMTAARPISPVYTNNVQRSSVNTATRSSSSNVVGGTSPADMIKARQNYYGENHKTAINKGVTNSKQNGNPAAVFIFVLMVIIGMIMSMISS